MQNAHAINADLHCHSTVSDGLSPSDVAPAHAGGVAFWSLTDHDEVGGQIEARAAAEALGMRYVPGVEISVTWAGQTVHIVGLQIDPFHPDLIDGLAKTRDGRARGRAGHWRGAGERSAFPAPTKARCAMSAIRT
jgi:predicted metal-dependent phosphoesterase TrpH